MKNSLNQTSNDQQARGQKRQYEDGPANYPDWIMPTVQDPPPAIKEGLTGNDILGLVMDLGEDFEHTELSTIFHTFSKMVTNRLMFVGPGLLLMAENLKCMIDKIEWFYEYDGGPQVEYREKELSKLWELVVLMENTD
jgi:hypothetical protein